MKKKFVSICIIVLVLVLALFVLSACNPQSAEYDTELLSNGGFETTTSTESSFVFDGWKVSDSWNDSSSDYQRVEASSNDPETAGSYYLSISNTAASYAWLYQSVEVERRQIYKVSVDIKVSGTLSTDTGRGAYVTFLENVDYIFSEVKKSAGDNGKNGWETHTFYVRPLNTDYLTIALCLGKEGETCKGTVYFDNASMTKVQSAPDGVTVTDFRKSTVARYNSDAAGIAFVTVLSILTVALFVAAFVAVRKLYARSDAFVNFDGTTTVGGAAEPAQNGKNRRRKSAKATPAKVAAPVWKNCVFVAAMIMLGAFLVRLILLLTTYGFGGETTLMADLARYLAKNGVGNVYADAANGVLSNGNIATMSPGTVYILAIVGLIGGSLDNVGLSILLRMVGVLADMATVAMIYFYGRKYAGDKLAVVYASLYALLPVVFVMSGMANTFEAVLVALMVGAMISLVEKKYIATYVIMAFAAVLDIRALALAPIAVTYMGYMYYRDDDNLRAFGKNRAIIVFGLIGAFVLAYLLTLPVAINHLGENAFYGFEMIANQMLNNSIFVDNAFGFYGMVTLNQKGFNQAAAILNLLFILVLAIFVCSLYFKKRNRHEVLLLASYMLAMVATFTLKVNYTYLFLSIALGIMYAMVAGEKRVYGVMGGYALLSMLCVGLLVRNAGFATSSTGFFVNFETTGADFIVFSVFTVLLTAYYTYVVYNITNSGNVVDIKPLSRPLGQAIGSSVRGVFDTFKRKSS